MSQKEFAGMNQGCSVLAVALVLALGGVGCGKKDGDSSSQASSSNEQLLVCSPFGSSGANSSLHGVMGSIYSFDSPIMQASTGVDDLQARSTLLNAKVVMNNINVPPMKFNLGFPVDLGGSLLGADGSLLMEYFSLHLEGALATSTDTDEAGEAGYYQLATISDDGIRVKIKDQGSDFRTLISNESPHSPTLNCATEVVHLVAGQKIPFQVDYFQGPREQLAMMLVWRKLPVVDGVPQIPAESGCGVVDTDNTYFFDSNQNPSAPQSLWIAMQSRGWAPVPSKNIYTAEGAGPNPCVK